MVFEKFLEKRTIGVAAMGALGLAALTGCGGPTIEKDKPATVVQHVDHPAYTSFVMVGKVPVFIHHPETFGLEVQQCGRAGDEGADQNGCVEEEVEVSKQAYDQYPDGSTIVFSEDK